MSRLTIHATMTTATRGVTVATVLRDLAESRALDLELLAGAGGLDRRITNPHPQKTGLALSGFDAVPARRPRARLRRERGPVPRDARRADERGGVLRRVFSHALPCLLVTGGVDAAAGSARPKPTARSVPLLRTRAATPMAMARLSAVLDVYLAARGVVHGVLMDILGLGVLIVGESGIGKSECALDLVVRGHRLVADDAVELRCRAESFLIGTCPELTRHHMEIRGLGLINVQDLFGVASTRTSKRVELVVQLERWDPAREYDRLGLDEATLRDARRAHADDPDAGGARAATSRSWWRSPRATSCCAPAAITRRGGSSSGSNEQLGQARERRTSISARTCDAREAPRGAARGAHGGHVPVRGADRPVGVGQVAGDPRARGSRLLLRRQPAGRAAADARGADAARRQRDRPRRGRRRRPRRARCSTSSRASTGS